MDVAIGVDIGGTRTKFGLIGENGEVLQAHHFQTGEVSTFEDYGKKLNQNLLEIIEQLAPEQKLLGLGVGAPNAISTTGEVINPPNLPWGSVPLKEIIHRALPDTPIFVQNDANTAAIGEKYWGLARNLKNFAVITLGTGIGSGLYIHDQLFEATEGGHTIIEINGRKCSCGGRGHLEAYASVGGILQTAQELKVPVEGFRSLVDQFHNDDPDAKKVMDQTAEYLGLGLASMGNLLCLESFILTGGVSAAGEKFRQQIHSHLDENLFSQHQGKISLYLSNFPPSKGSIVGAGALVFRGLNTQ